SLRVLVRARSRLIAVGDHAAAAEPVRLVDAAGKAPAAGHPVATIHDDGAAGRAEAAGDDHVRVSSPDGAGCLLRQVRAEGAMGDADEEVPPDGAIQRG